MGLEGWSQAGGGGQEKGKNEGCRSREDEIQEKPTAH
jgi:hypothetical protein